MRQVVVVALGLMAAACVAKTVTPLETVMGFDHDGANTESYALCWSPANCAGIWVTPIEGTTEKRFNLPVGVPDGEQDLFVVAIGPGGQTYSDLLRVRVVR